MRLTGLTGMRSTTERTIAPRLPDAPGQVPRSEWDLSAGAVGRPIVPLGSRDLPNPEKKEGPGRYMPGPSTCGTAALTQLVSGYQFSRTFRWLPVLLTGPPPFRKASSRDPGVTRGVVSWYPAGPR